MTWPTWSPDDTAISAPGPNPPNVYTNAMGTFTRLTLFNPNGGGYGQSKGSSWSPDSRFIAMGTNGTTIYVYDNLLSLTQIITASSQASTAWSDDSTLLVAGTSVTPFISLYAYETFTSVTFVASALAGAVRQIEWAAEYLIAGHDTTPFFSVLRHETGGTFTKLADPATLPGNYGLSVSAVKIIL
jgi:WD40 repeat protein